MHESEKRKWNRSVMSDPQRPHGLQPSRLLHPWDFPGKSTGVGCHCLLWTKDYTAPKVSAVCLDYLISSLYPTSSRPTDCHAVSKIQQSSLQWPSRYLHASLPYFLQISAQIRFHQRGLFPRSNMKWPTLVNSISFHSFGLLYFALLSHDMLIVYFLLIEA